MLNGVSFSARARLMPAGPPPMMARSGVTAVPSGRVRASRIAASHPLGRLGQPEDIVPMALLLLSDQGAWITGQAIGVDGGFNAGHHEDI